jgi:hypothetical protein
MGNRAKLTKKQLVVIEDLFIGGLDEQAVLEKHRVSRSLYDKWLEDDDFNQQFDRRIARAYRQSRAIIARYAPLAAAKLVQLTESEKEETARKACLDIISLPTLEDKIAKKTTEPQADEMEQPLELTEQAASRLLAALAEEKHDG